MNRLGSDGVALQIVRTYSPLAGTSYCAVFCIDQLADHVYCLEFLIRQLFDLLYSSIPLQDVSFLFLIP